MIEDQRVAVVGLGLIGGSIARDLAAQGMRVAGFDADAATLDAAVGQGIVSERLDSSLGGLQDATIVVLAVPISAMEQVFSAAANHVGRAALVTDVASTKRSVVALATSLGVAWQFVGSHPMAGDHRSGWMSARTGLFDDAPVYLCPTRETEPDSIDLAERFWSTLGARPRLTNAEAHDQLVAFTSHLPHVVSAAIALALSKAEVASSDLGPGGRDVLRIAASSPDLWSSIAADNAEAILGALGNLRTELAAFTSALEARDAGALHALFTGARAWSR